jgi:WD40 repeat protein
VSTTSGSRPGAGTATDPAATGLRDMIQQAVTAYELAVATQAGIASQAARRYQQGRKDLDAREATDVTQREDAQRARQAAAEAEAARVKALADLAAQLAESANSLLDRASLAHVRGFGPVSAEVTPHIASDEQAAAAFRDAQVASVNLRVLLLRVAQAYVDRCDWRRGIEVAAPLTAGPAGQVASEAAAVVHEASVAQVRELLSGGDPKIARAKAEAWLSAHPEDTEMSGLLLEATIELADQAEASGERLDADSDVTAIMRRYRADDSRLRELIRRRPQVAWRVGEARLLGEFGTHRYPVRALGLTADGNHLVSADSAEIFVWDLTASTGRSPVHSVPMAGVQGLSPDGTLALGKDGSLRRTDSGSQVSEVEAMAAYAFSRDGSLLAGAVRASKAWRFTQGQLSSQYAGQSLEETLDISANQGNAIRQGVGYAAQMHQGSPIESAKMEDAVSVTPGSYGNSMYAVRFINSLQVADVISGQQIRIALDLSHAFVDIAISAISRKLAMLDPQGQVLVADIDSGALVPMLAVSFAPSMAQSQAQSLLNSVAFSPGGDLILVARAGRPASGTTQADNKTVMTLWDISRGCVLWSWTTSRREGAVAFSPDGQLIATLAMDGTVSLFDVHAKQALPELGGGRSHGTLTSPCLAFSADGSRLAVSGYRDVKIWGL